MSTILRMTNFPQGWMRLLSLVALCTAGASSHAESATPQPRLFQDKMFEVRQTKNIAYASGVVNQSTHPVNRQLLMDVYEPVGENLPSSRPALIMAFGGAFHRGTKAAVDYIEGGAQNTSVAEYCREFARRGYVCFSIEYRLTPEDPMVNPPIDAQKLMPPNLATAPAATGRIELVRKQMGLPPLDAETRMHLWNGILAASEDMGKAVTFVEQNAANYHIDLERIAIGGFSAGAITALNLAYGAEMPVKAVVSLSGSLWGYNVLRTLRSAPKPPLLLVVGQYDLPPIRQTGKALLERFETLGIPVEFYWVPGYSHFYPRGAITLGGDATQAPVEARIQAFLFQSLELAPLVRQNAKK